MALSIWTLAESGMVHFAREGEKVWQNIISYPYGAKHNFLHHSNLYQVEEYWHKSKMELSIWTLARSGVVHFAPEGKKCEKNHLFSTLNPYGAKHNFFAPF